MPAYYWELLGRSWHAFTGSLGSTTLGFLTPGILVPIVGGLLVFVVTLAREGRSGLLSHLGRTFTLAAIIAFAGEVLVYGSIFGYEALSTIYGDHQELSSLRVQNRQLSSSLEWRRDNISTTDPVFPNIIYLLQAFQIYRLEQKGKPCVIYVTSKPDSSALASVVAQFSNSVSGCSTFGPDAVGNPDLEEMAADGMVPGVIVVHTQRDDKAALGLQERLGNQIQTRLSYRPPALPKNRLYAGSRYNYTESFVWLQFGSGVKWNSELFARPRVQ